MVRFGDLESSILTIPGITKSEGGGINKNDDGGSLDLTDSTMISDN